MRGVWRRPLRGFTLVEVLVAMSLMSLVMLAMMSALRTTAQTEERVDRKMLAADEVRVVSSFLRSTLGRVSARKTTAPVNESESPFYFSGGPNEMTGVGVMPARHGAGGRHHFRLWLDGRAGEGDLMLQYLPWSGNALRPDWSKAESQRVAQGVQSLSLQYLDTGVEPPAWSDQWTLRDRLPNRVSVALRTAAGTWPEIVVALRPLIGSDMSVNGPVFGTGR